MCIILGIIWVGLGEILNDGIELFERNFSGREMINSLSPLPFRNVSKGSFHLKLFTIL